MLYIDPIDCIDCEACVPECPVEAIFAEANTPAQWTSFIQLNTERTAQLKADNQTAANSVETSGHLARLWANDEIARLISAGSRKTEDAQKLAASYQLVTPVSGAVVLETQQQYEQNGLEPVKANTVPTIPEPETWMLIAVAGAVIIFLLYRRKKECDIA